MPFAEMLTGGQARQIFQKGLIHQLLISKLKGESAGSSAAGVRFAICNFVDYVQAPVRQGFGSLFAILSIMYMFSDILPGEIRAKPVERSPHGHPSRRD